MLQTNFCLRRLLLRDLLTVSWYIMTNVQDQAYVDNLEQIIFKKITNIDTVDTVDTNLTNFYHFLF